MNQLKFYLIKKPHFNYSNVTFVAQAQNDSRMYFIQIIVKVNFFKYISTKINDKYSLKLLYLREKFQLNTTRFTSLIILYTKILKMQYKFRQWEMPLLWS